MRRRLILPVAATLSWFLAIGLVWILWKAVTFAIAARVGWRP